MKNRRLPVIVLACLLSTPIAAWCQGDSAAQPDAAALFAQGVELAQAGRRAEAESVFRQLIDRHPDMPEAYNNLAVIQAGAGDFDDAVATLKGALATNPSYRIAYENLTRIFAQLASEAYSRALEVDSPPAREQVELQMLAELTRPAPLPTSPMPAQAEDRIAREKLTPVEPMAAPEEPAAMEESTPKPGDTAPSAPSAPSDESTEPAAMEEAAAAGAPAPEPELESEDLEMTEMESPAAVANGEFAGVVGRWAEAWSDQRADDYLAFYAADFVPDNGMSRQEWEANRRERLARPEYIKVEVAILDSVSEGDDRAKVTFLQAYESNTYADQVTKTLTLVRDGAQWKILEEKSGS